MEACVTHIVPLFAPVIDGVGDYALNLARHLRARRGMESRFVVADGAWKGGPAVDGFAVAGPSGFERARMESMLGEEGAILLHYVGYGFHPRGIPKWLVNALESRVGKGGRLVTIFHEIWSSGPPWKSVFYLAPMQRRLVRRILSLSEHCFTSTKWAARQLEALKPRHVTWMPVASSMRATGRPGRRARKAPPWRPLFFGQTWTRTPAIKRHLGLLQAMNERNLLDRALVMGKQASGPPSPSEDVALLQSYLPARKIAPLGEKAADEAEAGFQEADFCLSPHPARDACKSSAVMSAFACGCPTVLPNGEEASPLTEGKEFLACDGSPGSIDRFLEAIAAGALPRISENARAWYLREADWDKLAGEVARRILPAEGKLTDALRG